MKYLKSKKGFTLVELIISIGIMGIVLSAIFSFFLFNYKTFIRADNQIEAQYQAQIAINELIENIIEAEELSIADLGSKVEDKYPVEILVFKIFDEDEKSDTYIKYKYEGDKLYRTSKIKISSDSNIENHYKKDEFKTNQYAVGITDFKIELIGGDKTELKKVKGIKVFITSNIDNEEIQLKNQVYFRNWKEDN